MYNAPPPNLMQGIQLAQSGYKAEALAYLRLAAHSEPMAADGWLWLAAVTDDRDEYRTCVQQALALDSRHPTALRMRDDLERQDRWGRGGPATGGAGFAPVYTSSAAPAEYTPARQAARRAPSRGQRVLRAVVLLLIVGGGAAGIIALAASGIIQDRVRDWLLVQKTHSLEFAIGTTPPYRFRVEVPETWLPADEDNQTWLSKRDALAAAFPASPDQISLWEQIDESFSETVRDPVYGVMIPNVRLVETDGDALQRDGMVAALTLQEIVPLPELPPGQTPTVCGRMRLLEQQFQADGSLASVPDNEVIESALARRGKENCLFTIHRRYTHQLPQQVTFAFSPDRAPQATRSLMLAVPVGGDQVAVWMLTFADTGYDGYQSAIDRIIRTLEYLP